MACNCHLDSCTLQLAFDYGEETEPVWVHLQGGGDDCLVKMIAFGSRDVKFVFFPNSNFVFKIRILFELRLGPQ